MESTNGKLSEDTLRKHFSNYGEVEEALILSDNDRGNERGFGYVTFKDPAGPIHALNQQHYILDTKVRFFFFCVNCFYFYPGFDFFFLLLLASFFSFCLSFH